MKKYILKISILSFAFFTSGCKEPQIPKKSESSSHIKGETSSKTSAQQEIVKNPSQILKINILEEPQTLDPRKVRGLREINLSKLMMEGLTRTNKEGKAELALAKEVTVSDDLKTYTFKLRPTKWSNGDPITAHDFVYSWKKVLNPDFPSDFAFQLYVIKNAKSIKTNALPLSFLGAKAVDDETLVVELEYPVPYFLELLTIPTFFPVPSKLDKKDPHWVENAETFVSNGPFILHEWKHHNLLIAKKNPHYWDAKAVKLDQIEMMMVSEETGFNLFENHELDWDGSPFSTIPIDAIRSLKDRNQLHASPLLGTFFIRIHTGKPPFNSVAMRRAFALAIDRKSIIDHVTQGNQIPATGLVPASMNLQASGSYFSDGDKEAAVALFEEALAQSKLIRANLPEITLSYATGERNHRIAQALQQQWFEAFGVKVALQPLEGKVYLDAVSKKNYMIASSSWVADFNDPANFLEVFKSKRNGTNNTDWENSEYASLLEASYFTKDEEGRYNLLKDCENILMEEMPIIPLFHYTMLYVQSPKVKDVVLSSMGNIDFKWAFLENEQNRGVR